MDQPLTMVFPRSFRPKHVEIPSTVPAAAKHLPDQVVAVVEPAGRGVKGCNKTE